MSGWHKVHYSGWMFGEYTSEVRHCIEEYYSYRVDTPNWHRCSSWLDICWHSRCCRGRHPRILCSLLLRRHRLHISMNSCCRLSGQTWGRFRRGRQQHRLHCSRKLRWSCIVRCRGCCWRGNQGSNWSSRWHWYSYCNHWHKVNIVAWLLKHSSWLDSLEHSIELCSTHSSWVGMFRHRIEIEDWHMWWCLKGWLLDMLMHMGVIHSCSQSSKFHCKGRICSLSVLCR